MSQAPRTIQEIARMANASIQDVTGMILGKQDVDSAVRLRIQTAMADLELIKISEQHTTSLRKIVAVIPIQPNGDYIGKVVQGISEVLRRTGYKLELYVQNTVYTDALMQIFKRSDCEGVIPIAAHDYAHIIQLCHQFEKEYVLIDYAGSDDLEDTLTVEVNNYQGIQSVMHHLFGLGHRRIAFITGNLEQVSAQERLRGYQEAMVEAGMPYDNDLIALGDWSHRTAYKQAHTLLKLEHPPTAIVCSNDLSAFGVIHAARESGFTVGSRLSVTGFDDIAMASTVNPPLTTVRQPMTQMGRTAAELLIKRLIDEDIPSPHIMMDTELIVRSSTGTAPAHLGI